MMVGYDRICWATDRLIDPAARSLRSLKVRRAFEVLDPPLTGQVLDLGCGDGGLTRTLRRWFPQAQVHGCDISPAQVSRARERDSSIDYCVCGETLPYEDQSFEAVFVMDVLEHVEDPARLIREIHRVLRPGGKWLLHCPCEGQPGSLHWLSWKTGWASELKREMAGHVQRFSRKGILDLAARQGFIIRRIRYSYHLGGQGFDLLTSYRIRCQRETAGGRPSRGKRFVAWLPWWRWTGRLESLAYWESRLLGRWAAGMGLDGFFVKEGMNENRR